MGLAAQTMSSQTREESLSVTHLVQSSLLDNKMFQPIGPSSVVST